MLSRELYGCNNLKPNHPSSGKKKAAAAKNAHHSVSAMEILLNCSSNNEIFQKC